MRSPGKHYPQDYDDNAAVILHPCALVVFFFYRVSIVVDYTVYIRRACRSHGRTVSGKLATCWISIIWALMHIFPLGCIDQFIASVSIGPQQYSRPMCPSLKASCKTQTSFLYPLQGQIFNFGCYSMRNLLLAPSTPSWICSLPESYFSLLYYLHCSYSCVSQFSLCITWCNYIMSGL